MSHRLSTNGPGPPSSETSFIGIETDTGSPFSFSAYDLSRHCYMIGSTGAGKTNLILRLLERDIRSNQSVVVIDMRGDLVAGTIGICQSLAVDPNRVSLLDLREKERIQGFDPLSGAGEPHIRALHLLDVISGESAGWGVQLEETMRNCFLLLASANEPVTRLEAVFYDDAFRASCLAMTDDVSIIGFWERFGSLSRDRRQTWALPVLNKVTPLLATPTLRAVLSGNDPLNLDSVLGTPGSILLVSLAVDELHRSSRMIGSLVISSIAREMLARVNVPERLRNPVRLYVDEFETMASDAFEGIIAEGRRFGCMLVLAHQTQSQIPARLRSVIRNNVGVQVIFQVGFEDASSIAKELPKEVTAPDLRSLAVGQALVMWRDGETVHVTFSKAENRSSPGAAEAFRASVLPSRPAKANPGVPVPEPKSDNARSPVLEELI